MSEHHDCAIPDCATWGTLRWKGHIPGVGEVDGYVCEHHAGDWSVGPFSLATTDERGYTPGNEPLPWNSQPVPKPTADEHFVPINRKARRQMDRQRRRK